MPTTIAAYRPPLVPAWAAAHGTAISAVEAAFLAGGALNSLDAIVRAAPEWIGVWRQRQALKCAVSAVQFAGRGEDEAALRDAFVLRKPGDETGPAGAIYMAWSRLASCPASPAATIDAKSLRAVADLLGLRWSGELASVPGVIDDIMRSGKAGPFAAASIATSVCALRPDAETLAWWLADWMLAQAMRWECPVPLLMAQRYSAAFRTAGGRGRVRPEEPAFERAVCVALALGAAEGCRLATEIARRADRLAAVTPKLRAKGAGDAIRLLLGEDAVSGTLQTPKLSRFASRRLFERLIELDAVRELSGRSAFRIYGL
ncbi:DUF1403 family protein [Rhizobium herbae]|uniref:DUF1403 family protein n=1 Tax=Rhizobium herbae TaxID=508661 RepID=A0ABS4EQ22_9HYPH|nr:hypothetical protein [Rhizobium herbae]